MKKIISRLVLMLLLFCFTQIAHGYYVFQTDWAGGSGVSGPVTAYWNDTFSDENQTSYAFIPMGGKLQLAFPSTTHVISAEMVGCNLAFPADMDSDGDVDVLTSETSSSSLFRIVWFENDGNGEVWNIHIIAQDYPIMYCVYPSDLDGDGDMDVVGAKASISVDRIEWWRNDDGIGDTWTRFTIADSSSSIFVCAEDIDGDSLPDVSAPLRDSGSSDNIEWWGSVTTPPDSAWNTHVVTSSIDHGYELFMIDLDQDGDMDIISACWDQHGLYWWENLDGVGLSWTGHEIGSTMSFATSCHAADIDSDGDIDVVYGDTEHNEVKWCENMNGSGTSWQRHLLESDFDPRRVHAADVTEDGFVDILSTMDHDLLLFMNMDGSGDEWARLPLQSGWKYGSVNVADFDGNGRADILTSGLTVQSWYELSPYSTGWLESSILDVNSYPQWDSITWTAEEPVDTDIFFQIRTSNDWEDMGSWCDTIFEPSSLVGIIDSTHRYIQYRAGMTSDDGFTTPTLDEVRFYWTYLGIEGEAGGIEFSITAAPNPSMNAVSIIIPPAFSEDVQFLVYDISGKIIADLSDTEGDVFQWDCKDSSGRTVPSGIYIIQGIVGDRSTSVRFVKL